MSKTACEQAEFYSKKVGEIGSSYETRYQVSKRLCAREKNLGRPILVSEKEISALARAANTCSLATEANGSIDYATFPEARAAETLLRQWGL